MDFDLPSKLQELPVLLIIPLTLILKGFLKNEIFDENNKTAYKSFINYLEIFFFLGLIIMSLFDKLLSVFSLLIFFLYSLDQSIRLISLGVKNIAKKKKSDNSKIIIIGILILVIILLLCYISIKNISK